MSIISRSIPRYKQPKVGLGSIPQCNTRVQPVHHTILREWDRFRRARPNCLHSVPLSPALLTFYDSQFQTPKKLSLMTSGVGLSVTRLRDLRGVFLCLAIASAMNWAFFYVGYNWSYDEGYREGFTEGFNDELEAQLSKAQAKLRAIRHEAQTDVVQRLFQDTKPYITKIAELEEELHKAQKAALEIKWDCVSYCKSEERRRRQEALREGTEEREKRLEKEWQEVEEAQARLRQRQQALEEQMERERMQLEQVRMAREKVGWNTVHPNAKKKGGRDVPLSQLINNYQKQEGEEEFEEDFEEEAPGPFGEKFEEGEQEEQEQIEEEDPFAGRY
ncbi:hypothetical protein QOT17_002385 [Balamuthia mandrillaris]